MDWKLWSYFFFKTIHFTFLTLKMQYICKHANSKDNIIMYHKSICIFFEKTYFAMTHRTFFWCSKNQTTYSGWLTTSINPPPHTHTPCPSPPWPADWRVVDLQGCQYHLISHPKQEVPSDQYQSPPDPPMLPYPRTPSPTLWLYQHPPRVKQIHQVYHHILASSSPVDTGHSSWLDQMGNHSFNLLAPYTWPTISNHPLNLLTTP